MNKRYITKLENLIKKLKTANDKEAYKMMKKLESFCEKAQVDIVKQDFSLSKNTAASIIMREFMVPFRYHRSIMSLDSVAVLWKNQQNKRERVALSVLYQHPCQIVLVIMVYKCDMVTGHAIPDRLALGSDYEPMEAPEELAKILGSLKGFANKTPGVWVRKINKVKNLAQFKKEVLPICNEVYDTLKNFGENWGNL
jgi:hypothetical protein